jgi:flagellar basal-body rod protein FlgF
VQTANGLRFTRDGRFATNAQGQLVTQAGDNVLDTAGSPITLNPQGGPPQIGGDGTITQTVGGQSQSQTIGRVGVVNFTNLAGLSKDGAGLFSNPSGETPQAVTGQVLRQGALEASNVQPIAQVTDLIRVSRAYDMMAQMMNSTASLSQTAVQRLGAATTPQ